MYRQKHKRKSRIFGIRRSVFLIAALLFVALVVGVSAKYIYDRQEQTTFAAKEFYFTSNLLSEETSTYILNSSVTEISFTLGNNEDDLRFSEDTITYALSLSVEGSSDVGTAEISDDGNNTLTGKTISKKTITITNLQKGKTYLVTATGSAGYEKTLRAKFTVSDKAENVYKHLDTTTDPAYVILTVWTENVAGSLYVEVPSGLVPDNTDPAQSGIVDAYDDVNDAYVGFDFTDPVNFKEKYSSYAYRFFKDTESAYDVDNFVVQISQDGVKYISMDSIP